MMNLEYLRSPEPDSKKNNNTSYQKYSGTPKKRAPLAKDVTIRTSVWITRTD